MLPFSLSTVSIMPLHRQINMDRRKWSCPSDLGAKPFESAIVTTERRDERKNALSSASLRMRRPDAACRG